jgi:hypothetical protein
MKFNQILAGKRVRCFEVADQRLIQHVTGQRVDETPQTKQIRLWIERVRDYQEPKNFQGFGAAYADDSDTAPPRGRRQGDDRIGMKRHGASDLCNIVVLSASYRQGVSN